MTQESKSKSESFKNITAGIQSIIVAVGLLVAGVWTAYTFKTELHAQNARAKLEELQRNIDGRAAFSSKLDVTPISVNADRTTTHILVDVTIENPGSRDTYLVLAHKPPVALSRVSFNTDASPNVEPQFESVALLHHYTSDGEKSDGPIIRAGEKDVLSFCLPVNDPGLYLCEFRGELPARDNLNPDGPPKPGNLLLQKYVTIPKFVEIFDANQHADRNTGSNRISK